MSDALLPTRSSLVDNREDVPDAVVKFVQILHKAIISRKVHDVQAAYDIDYNKVNDKFFKASAWPPGEAISGFCDRNENTILLYKEMFFRQAFTRAEPTLEERIDSYKNYINLFNTILGLKEDQPEIELPPSWLWDMIEAFIDQFQSFHFLRSNAKEHSQAEQVTFAQNEHVWAPQTVVVFLEAIIKKAQLTAVPSVNKSEDDEGELDDIIDAAEKKDAPADMFTTLGHFASIGLAFVQMLLCDYYGAIQALNSIDLMSRKEPHRRSLGASSYLHFTLVFSFFMARRYVDCIKMGSYFLSYIGRNDSLLQRCSLTRRESIIKRVEQINGVVAMAISICPTYLDDQITQNIARQLGDRVTRMQKDHDLTVYGDIFSISAPRFVNLEAPKYDGVDHINAVLNLQLKVFLNDIKQRSNLSDIYSYLDLCSTVSTTKLASFLKVDEGTLGTYLLNVKHKTRNLRWTGGPATDGKWESQSQVDFTVNKGMVQVADTSSASKFGHYFIRQILRLNEVTAEIRK